MTIENINKYTYNERISQLMGSSELLHGKFSLLRAYIKNQEDFVEVKTIYNDHLPKIPIFFIETDICLDNLLVEIEAEFIVIIPEFQNKSMKVILKTVFC